MTWLEIQIDFPHVCPDVKPRSDGGYEISAGASVCAICAYVQSREIRQWAMQQRGIE